ncbi:bacteriocin immunity protein [Dellaglioa algida]|uniref:Bacteriocin immunity protein n=1 Tax=Dellaglioa algida DSM 15638 TaxID=1423719 RepID=A0A0R1HGT6_9LACO|nr:bacteriocin immunity protein [Dellaglioa algida]KRK45725.1 hypothetical protein FC66_GL001184 [Dellaglioa algida DSM 15638]MDK1733196.1 bacteriocin immunity protein [Dellaglioa algida]MDK1734717.1 bacteriocin immunity protein [Dellaglioa algida]
MTKNIIVEAKTDIQNLRTLLEEHQPKSTGILDIDDVLTQVYKKLDSSHNPEALINRLVNYIRSIALADHLHFPENQEKLIIGLSAIGQKAGLNGLYMADFSDKSQFYSYIEEIPRRN